MKSDSSMAVASITTVSTNAKDSRRRQYRSCDRCRVGKRACNAEYESVAEAINNKVACSNCRKKGKTCSFQYVLSILGGVPSTSSSAVQNDMKAGSVVMLPISSQHDNTYDNSDGPSLDDRTPHRNHHRSTTSTTTLAAASTDLVKTTTTTTDINTGTNPVAAYNVGAQWSLAGSRSDIDPRASSDPSFMHAATMAAAAAAYKNIASISPMSSTMRITTAIDRIFLNDGLIRVYEGAAEQALQCWITSSNTPYMLASQDKSASQQLVYWRICELDRGARRLLGHATGKASREREIMDAFHSVVLAFAAQWSPHWISGLADKAQLSTATVTGYGLNKTSENKVRLALWQRARDKLQKVANVASFRVIFALILFAWTEKPREVVDRATAANDADIDLNSENCALDTSAWQSPAEGSTFLLVAAMRKLLSIKFKIEGKKRRGMSPWNAPNGKAEGGTSMSGAPAAGISQQSSVASVPGGDACSSSGPAAGEDDDEANENLTMARKIQSDLESKAPITSSHGDSGENAAVRNVANAAEVLRMEGTYHMLYWLCVVIDTETSVLRKHPPVVCDEDSEVIAGFHGDFANNESSQPTEPAAAATGQKGIWDDYIINISKRKQQTEFASSWPCDEKKAAATLAFSTPVKVVMFRQISRLQMSFWRRASTQAVEQHIRSGLLIIYHWNQIYGRLIDSCRESHASLPASIQSWYVLLAFPWYLAILLFVEMVQTVDMAGASDKQARCERARSGIFPRLRDRACSDLALLIAAIRSTSFNHLEPRFQYVRDSGGNLLLTEPWSEILVHSITAVVKTEVKLHEGFCSLFKWRELEESHSRIELCLWALEQLSDRSPSAYLAHQQLEKLTSARKQGHFAFQQIPMASPPLHREATGAAARHSVGGPSPESDGDSNRASCGFDTSVVEDGGDASALGFGEPSVVGGGNDCLESALDTYFATNASSMHANSARLRGSRDQVEQQLVGSPSETDYLQLLQMLEQAEPTQIGHAHTSTLSSSLNIASAAAGGSEQLSIEPLSILETLAQLTNQPVRDLLSLSSDASTSSVDTAFSLESADWNLDFSLASTAIGQVSSDDMAMVTTQQHRDAGGSSAATSVASCSDSDSEDDHHHSTAVSRANKKAKYMHPSSSSSSSSSDTLNLVSSTSSLQFVNKPSFTSADFTIPHRQQALSSTTALSTKFMSVPLQPIAQREHDDLYGDDDDDDLMSFRDNLKRKRDHDDMPSTIEATSPHTSSLDPFPAT
ncbi:related to regulatory protein alcR [Ustilago trichophora]|uniref:Related to regulatory protein alcR n=1 Tax=Ustilago trichophora TaxID=86804 RepID=A0A5C3ED36_9BASI|nr:related to regulatory protein alcR [Ustilago trichophora]